jgi:hypothetical protein
MTTSRLVIDESDVVERRGSLALVNEDGSEVWRVKPPNGTADRWTDARLDGETVTAFSWSCYRVTIDVATGAELSRVLTK